MNEPLMNPQIIELIEKNGKAPGTLIGVDGNAFAVIGYVQRQLNRNGWARDETQIVVEHMMSGDYNNVLATGMSVLQG